jgi:hypothetical protein
MKRKLFVMTLAAMSACVMMACGSKDDSKKKADAEQVAEEAVDVSGEVVVDEPADVDEPVDEPSGDAKQAIVKMVNALYDDIKAVNASRNDGKEAPDIDFINKYCSKEFRALVAKIREIDRNKPADEGFGMGDNWGSGMWEFFDPPYELVDLDVEVDGNEGTVCYYLKKGGEKAEMDYSVVFEDGKWCFSDCDRIGMLAGSWIDRMTEYIEENK